MHSVKRNVQHNVWATCAYARTHLERQSERERTCFPFEARPLKIANIQRKCIKMGYETIAD